MATFETRSVSKSALAVAGFTGVALSLVLGRVLIPSGGGDAAQVADIASTSSARSVTATLVVPSSPVVSTTIKVAELTTTVPGAVEPVATPSPPPTAEAVPGTVTEPSVATLSNPEPRIGAAVVSIGDTDHLGVLWNGRHAIATTGAGELGATLSLRLRDGSTLDSIVVAEDAGLVLLELVEPTQADEVATAWPHPDGDARYIGTDGRVSSVVVEPGTDGVYSLDNGAIGEGHSVRQGTPVIDGEGRFIGMCAPGPDGVTTLVSWTPVESLMARADQLGAWIGVRSGSGPNESATIAEIAPSAPADAAGMLVGDVVMAIDGHPVGSLSELGGRLRVISPGSAVTLTLQRAGIEIAVVVNTVGRPDASDALG